MQKNGNKPNGINLQDTQRNLRQMQNQQFRQVSTGNITNNNQIPPFQHHQMGNTALGVMQQQSQQQGGIGQMPQGVAGLFENPRVASVYQNFGSTMNFSNQNIMNNAGLNNDDFRRNTRPSSMDASAGTSATLMTMMGGGTAAAPGGNSEMQNMQMLLQQQQQNPFMQQQMQHTINQSNRGGASSMPNTNNAMDTSGASRQPSQPNVMFPQSDNMSVQPPLNAANNNFSSLQQQRNLLPQQMQQKAVGNPSMQQQIARLLQQQGMNAPSYNNNNQFGVMHDQSLRHSPSSQHDLGSVHSQQRQGSVSFPGDTGSVHSSQPPQRQGSVSFHGSLDTGSVNSQQLQGFTSVQGAGNFPNMIPPVQRQGSVNLQQQQPLQISQLSQQQPSQMDQFQPQALQREQQQQLGPALNPVAFSNGKPEPIQRPPSQVAIPNDTMSQISGDSHQTNGDDSLSDSFLNGKFKGGWQTNSDLPERRQLIFTILEVLQDMRPDHRGVSERLPHVAKTLEEHLYRSARSKEEYLDEKSLRRRLKRIAAGLGTRRGPPGSSNIMNLTADVLAAHEGMQQQQQSLSHDLQPAMQVPLQNEAAWGQAPAPMPTIDQAGSSNWNLPMQPPDGFQLPPHQRQQSYYSTASMPTIGDPQGDAFEPSGSAVNPSALETNSAINPGSQQGWNMSNQAQSGIASTSAQQDRSQPMQPTDKSRVISQQQERLLLLRHVSKCSNDPSCMTKYCKQMTILWRHMNDCRDKNCSRPHCLSSRCVLNHYRICKSQGKTAKCEVCGPVMLRIQQQEEAENAVADLTPLPVGGGPLTSGQPGMTQATIQQSVNSQEILQKLGQVEKQYQQLVHQEAALDSQIQAMGSQSQKGTQLLMQKKLIDKLKTRCFEKVQSLRGQLQLAGGGALPHQYVDVSARGADQKPQAQGGLQPAQVRHGSLGAGKGKKLQLKNDDLEAVRRRSDFEERRQVQQAKSDAPNKPLDASTIDRSTSLIPFLSRDSVKHHLDSLNKRIRLSSRTVTHKSMPVIDELLSDQLGWVFEDPVDPVALGLPDYLDVVKNPMHLKLVKKKLENAIYSDIEDFARDCRLVFDNAILYNGEDSEVGEAAQALKARFENLYAAMKQTIEDAHHHLETKGDLCSLCGEQKLRFEASTLYCRGRCGMQRIKRGASYFTDHTKANHWCEFCFSELKPSDSIYLDDGSAVKMSDLQEFKNDALPEEGWVNCDHCDRWVHQICALFNGRRNHNSATFTCPSCYLKRLSGDEPLIDRAGVKGAAQLPRARMTDAIEQGIERALVKASEARAKELGVSIAEVEKVEPLSVRMLSDVEKKHMVGDEMLRAYESKGCPSDYSVRSKCIGLFQQIHGIDTLLFAMYVYEYGQDCPAPNRRRVYISYLDSIQYFQPKYYRTTVYQAIIVEYLRFVKQRGFHTAHIWSCPPTPGDDYIFYCHPSHQLIPREDMLRAWYGQALERAKAEGIVIRTSTLYDEYFTDDVVDLLPGQRSHPTCLPYFEGDYIPGEIENMISAIMERGGDPTALEGGTDEIMKRIGHKLQKMKDNFFVVHLRSRRFAAAVERGEDVSDWPEDSDDEFVRRKRAKITGKDLTPLPDVDASVAEGPALVEQSATSRTDQCPVLDAPTAEAGSPALGPAGASSSEAAETIAAEPVEQKSAAVEIIEAKPLGEMETKESPGGDSQSKKRELADVVSEERSKLGYTGGMRVGNTSDEDSLVENDLFESRQQFLNYCQTNHCQFDQLRRSKHSTMMLLFQLHNPLAPKFLQQCSSCYRDITHGTRYHCNECSNFDLCEECFEPIITGLWAKKDKRFAHDNSHTFAAIDVDTSSDVQKTRQERQKALRGHIQLIEHAASCAGAPTCQLQNCQKMKGLFSHVKDCNIRPKKECKICNRLLTLCALHARSCTVRGSCLVPFCDRFRERNGRLRKQQQLMDDRRRRAQNELYHTDMK